MGLFGRNKKEKKEKKDRKNHAAELPVEETQEEELPAPEPEEAVQEEAIDTADTEESEESSEEVTDSEEPEEEPAEGPEEAESEEADPEEAEESEEPEESEEEPEAVTELYSEGSEAKKKGGFFSRLKDGLKKTRGGLLGNIFRSEDRIDEDFYETLEEALIMADVGMETTEELIERLRAAVKESGIKSIPEARELMVGIMAEAMEPEAPFVLEEGRKAVILIVGVNGVGKTTTIGKLAHYYKESGLSIALAAADTFRAAAAEQLSEWAKRADVQIIKHGEGADPAAVVFDAIASYKAREREVLICDTAGRLHNKKNLMDELAKIRRVITRELPDVPVETLLVLDATTGQNAIKQAEAFSEATGLTGLVLTKLDGTAKGGVALAVKGTLGLPIRFVGVGEGINDMHPFNAEDFARALID